jgi:hypothetical protein
MVSTSHAWNFFRTGGLDQVALTTGADLLALEQLDQKLWVALSCPVKGLELDEKTLALIDSDADGRVRVPELLAAIKWAAARVKDPTVLLAGAAALPLAAINDATPEGKVLLASAKQILSNLGQKSATALPVEDAANTAKIFAASALNGDGVIPPEATEDAATQTLIKEIIATVGGTARSMVVARSSSAGDSSGCGTWVLQPAASTAPLRPSARRYCRVVGGGREMGGIAWLNQVRRDMNFVS